MASSPVFPPLWARFQQTQLMNPLRTPALPLPYPPPIRTVSPIFHFLDEWQVGYPADSYVSSYPLVFQACPKSEPKLSFPSWPSVSSLFWNVADGQSPIHFANFVYYRGAIVSGSELLTQWAEVTYLDRSTWQPVITYTWFTGFSFTLVASPLIRCCTKDKRAKGIPAPRKQNNSFPTRYNTVVLNSTLAANPRWTPTMTLKCLRTQFEITGNGNDPKSINRRIKLCSSIQWGEKKE